MILGANGSSVVARVRYAPRSGFASRMVGGLFQGSNVADFSTATTLFTVAAAPATGVYTEQTISNTTPFRYVRYISSSTGFGNVAEVEFLWSSRQCTSNHKQSWYTNYIVRGAVQLHHISFQ